MGIKLVLTALPVAVLLEGVRRKLMARFQGRKGPPVIQPFYDLIKLFNKERTEASESRNLIFYAAPVISLAIMIFNYLILFGVLGFNYDFVLFIYLFTTAGVILIIGSLSSKSPLSFVGGVREILYLIAYEVIFIFTALNLISKSGELMLSNYNNAGLFIAPVSSVLLLIAGFAILKVTPFDSPAASAEISSSMTAEYSGKLLFAYELADFFKNGLFYFTAAILLFGRNTYSLIFIPALLLFYALMNATTPRYSFIRSTSHLLFIALLSIISGGLGV